MGLQTKADDVDELKQQLINVWHGFEQSIIAEAISGANVSVLVLCGYIYPNSRVFYTRTRGPYPYL